MPEGALTSFTVCDAYRYFTGRAWLLMSQSRSRTEYLIPADNIIVIDDGAGPVCLLSQGQFKEPVRSCG